MSFMSEGIICTIAKSRLCTLLLLLLTLFSLGFLSGLFSFSFSANLVALCFAIKTLARREVFDLGIEEVRDAQDE